MLTFQPCCILAMFQNIGQQWPVPLFKLGFGSQFILLSYYIYSINALHLPETKQENKKTNETNLETNKQKKNENCTAAVDQICIKGTYLPRAWVSGCFPSSLCPAAGKSLNIDKAWQWDCSVSDCIRLLCISPTIKTMESTCWGQSCSHSVARSWSPEENHSGAGSQ